jgi:large subunit ribosomal protein L22
MLIIASQQSTRQTPRKVRLVANQVRKLSLEKALEQLAVIERRSTLVVLKTIRQAIANAQHNHGLAFSDLLLKNIVITEGPRYRRFRAVSRGRAHGIIKRTSNITVTLETASTSSIAKTTTQPAAKAAVVSDKKTEVGAGASVVKQGRPTTQELGKAASAQERSVQKQAVRSTVKQVRSTARPKKGAK